MNEILEVKKLTKNYNNLQVLNEVSFNINKGEFVSIIGPSGCGKTTLLKIISGLIKPTKGEVRFRDNSVNFNVKKGLFGFVFQNSVLLPWRNVIKNIELPLEILETKNKNKQKISKKLLKIVGLEGFENYYPNQLSGGMQQRVAIARALTFEPPILLMDEPFGALDEITRNYMNLELLRIWQEEETVTSTIIFVTHSISEAVFLSDKVIVLSERPSKIKKILTIDFPRPRKTEIKSSKEYFNLIECLRKTLKTD